MLPSRPTVGPYLGERLLGMGAHGVVWRARGPHGPVALKVARNDAATARLKAEAQALRTVRHPHLVRFIQAGPGWLATELIEGIRLDRWARDRSAAELLQVFLELADAVACLHDHGVLHGDLKPAQVLVDAWDHAKLVDPGVLDLEVPGGTPGFIAPELLQGGALSAASDVYGLAATMYAALCGVPPHADADPAAALHHATVTAPLPASAYRADLPAKVDHWITRALLRKPASRPSLQELRDMLTVSWKLPIEAPVLGMVRARQALHRAVCRAADGGTMVVVVHGPEGSGRRTLLGQALKQAALEGMTVHRHHDPEAFARDAQAGRSPAAAARFDPDGYVGDAIQFLSSGHAGLLVLQGPVPSRVLANAGALHIAPDALGLTEARHLGQWLGVPPAQVGRAWRRTQGHPQALWVAFEPNATQHTSDRQAFQLSKRTARLITTLAQQDGTSTLDALADRLGMSLPELSDHVDLLEATGRVRTEADGWRLRLLVTDDP